MTKVFKPGDVEWAIFHAVRGSILLGLNRWSESLADFRSRRQRSPRARRNGCTRCWGSRRSMSRNTGRDGRCRCWTRRSPICDKLPTFDRPDCADARSTLAPHPLGPAPARRSASGDSPRACGSGGLAGPTRQAARARSVGRQLEDTVVEIRRVTRGARAAEAKVLPAAGAVKSGAARRRQQRRVAAEVRTAGDAPGGVGQVRRLVGLKGTRRPPCSPARCRRTYPGRSESNRSALCAGTSPERPKAPAAAPMVHRSPPPDRGKSESRCSHWFRPFPTHRPFPRNRRRRCPPVPRFPRPPVPSAPPVAVPPEPAGPAEPRRRWRRSAAAHRTADARLTAPVSRLLLPPVLPGRSTRLDRCSARSTGRPRREARPREVRRNESAIGRSSPCTAGDDGPLRSSLMSETERWTSSATA